MWPRGCRGAGPGAQSMVIVAMSMNQLLGCTTFLILGDSARLVVETGARIGHQLVDLGVAVIAPVVRQRRESLGADEACHRKERVHRRETDVDRAGAVG